MLRNGVISLSLANLCMINMWHNLLYRAPSSSSNDYFLKASPYPLTLGAAFLDVLLLTAAILPFMVLAQRRKGIGSALGRLAILAMLFFAIYHVFLLGRSFFVGSLLSADDAGISFIYITS